MVAAATINSAFKDRVFEILAHVPDPEIPCVSVVDLGIVRDVTDDAVVRARRPMIATYAAQNHIICRAEMSTARVAMAFGVGPKIRMCQRHRSSCTYM